MEKNEESKKVSLSSWNYGIFFPLNPYFSQRQQSSENNKNEIQSLNTQKQSKISNNEDLYNVPYEQYIDRDRYLHVQFITKLKEKRIESQQMLKQNGKTFKAWKNQKNKKSDKTKINLEEEKNINDQIQKEFKLTFKKWKEKKIKSKKKEEEKRIQSEKEKKAEKEKINKERREQMLKWEKEKDELFKNKKKEEKKIIREKKIKEEKDNKEKMEKNKAKFIEWLKDKIKKNKLIKHKENSIDTNKKFKYERIKQDEIIGPFYFGKQLREAQKSFYKSLSKANKNKIPKRSNTSKK